MINFFRRLSRQVPQYRRDERYDRPHGFVVAVIERDTNSIFPERLIAPKR